MRNCLGIGLDDYTQEGRGGPRIGYSPLYHHPDLCPHFPDQAVGNCLSRCSGVRAMERPCNQPAGPAPATYTRADVYRYMYAVVEEHKDAATCAVDITGLAADAAAHFGVTGPVGGVPAQFVTWAKWVASRRSADVKRPNAPIHLGDLLCGPDDWLR